MFFFDPLYFVFALPALLLALFAQWRVRATYQKYAQIPNMRGLSGTDAARKLLEATGLGHVNLEGASGQLTDHYDPRSRTLRLSQGVATGKSVASLGIVAHELGHAVQHHEQYLPMRLRASIVPAANLGTYLGPILFVIGLLLNLTSLAWLGIILFSGAVVFSLVTLPVELDASRRALVLLYDNGLVDVRERDGARAVLNAAALTYFAALAQAVSNLLYYVFLLTGSRRR